MTYSSLSDFKSELVKTGLKQTKSRLAILSLLQENKTPLEAPEIIQLLSQKKLKTDSATVYRILDIFYEKGLLKKVHLAKSGVTYYELNTDDHHHFICQNCNIVEDVSDCNLQKFARTIEERKGVVIKSHSLEFFGLCKNCLKLNK